MLINGGSDVSAYEGFIANAAGINASATVDGPSSTWTMNQGLYVGHRGTGALNVTSGGQVSSRSAYIASNAGSVGNAIIDGAGSKWSVVGTLGVGFSSGSGTLSITNAGQVSTTAKVYVGSSIGSASSVTISGTGSKLTVNGDFEIEGNTSLSTIGIDSGGVLTSIGDTHYENNSLITVDGPGSTLSASYDQYIGYAGTATIHVTNGAQFIGGKGLLGFEANS
jgi:T5SS/PEP-CTERM-associated repeat protein